MMPRRRSNLGVLASGRVPPVLHVAYGVAFGQRLGYGGVIYKERRHIASGVGLEFLHLFAFIEKV